MQSGVTTEEKELRGFGVEECEHCGEEGGEGCIRVEEKYWRLFVTCSVCVMSLVSSLSTIAETSQGTDSPSILNITSVLSNSNLTANNFIYRSIGSISSSLHGLDVRNSNLLAAA